MKLSVPFRIGAVLAGFFCGGLRADPGLTRELPGLQDFNQGLPADVQPGRLVITGSVIHRAIDGSWFDLRIDSHWGSFYYLVTQTGRSAGLVQPAPSTPRPAPAALSARRLAWADLACTQNGSLLFLEGQITAVAPGGNGFDGRFAFSDGTVDLHWKLQTNHPLGADPAPTYHNIYYGPYARQKLDVYLARSSRPTPVAVYIHGGAWQTGDKDTVTEVSRFLAHGITVIAIDYRYIPAENPSPELPAVAVPLYDAARAIQYIRSRARDWNLDKTRMGLWGGSAGACTSMWLATHRDLADPAASDPVLRESTRPSCIGVIMPQTSLDPVQMRAWVGPELGYGPHAFGLGGSREGRLFDRFIAERPRLLPWIREYSPAALVRSDSAPMFLDYTDFDLKPCLPLDAYYTHSPGFGVGFAEVARGVGAECHLGYHGHEDPQYFGWEDFLISRLAGTPPRSVKNN